MLLPLTLLLAFLGPALTPGDTLPMLKGEFLDDKEAELPFAAKGKVTLVVIGFTHDAQPAMEDWTKRFRHDFGSDPGVTFFEITMVGGMRTTAKPFITGALRKSTPPEDYGHVITVFGNTGFWKDRLRYKGETEAYLVLLGQEGAIRWVKRGFLDEDKYGELAHETRRLLGK